MRKRGNYNTSDYGEGGKQDVIIEGVIVRVSHARSTTRNFTPVQFDE